MAGGHIEALAANGVEYLFGPPGSDDAPYWNYLAERKPAEVSPTYIQCRHDSSRSIWHADLPCSPAGPKQ